MTDKYVTRAELRSDPYLVSSDDADNTYLGILQDLTKEMIDRFCEQSFEQDGDVGSEVEYKVNGNGKDTVFTPYRLLTLSKVRIYSQANVYTDYDDDNFVNKIKYISFNVFSEASQEGRYSVDVFSKGNANIGIFGTWGWSAYPQAIKYLQGRLIQKLITDKAFANKYDSEKIGDFNYKLISDDTKITGDFELDTIIKHYRLWSAYGTY